MNPETEEMLRAAEESATRLVERCGKGGTLYLCNPSAVAQVSRNAKWLLNAIAVLRHELTAPEREAQP